MGLRVLVCGSRDWKNREAIERELDKLEEKIEIVIHGSCRGADLMAEVWAKKKELPYLGIPARWKTQHKAAGPIRNAKMLRDGKPNLVLAFHEDIENSAGTANMVAKAKKAGIEVRIYDS